MFMKVIFLVNVDRKGLFIPKGRATLYLNIVRLTDVLKQLTLSMKMRLEAKLMKSTKLLRNLARKLKPFDAIQL